MGNSIDTNTMVLGINEYLPKERKDKEVEFVGFKKFYQRISKNTGCEYKNWTDRISFDINAEKPFLRDLYSEYVPFNKVSVKHYLYIYGHSLDPTDKDILEDLILNDNVYTTIYYYERIDANGHSDNGRNDLNEKIANLILVIGQEALIRKTSGDTKTIEFKKVSDIRIPL